MVDHNVILYFLSSFPFLLHLSATRIIEQHMPTISTPSVVAESPERYKACGRKVRYRDTTSLCSKGVDNTMSCPSKIYSTIRL